MIKNSNLTYYLINETVVSQEASEKHFQILSENITDVGGRKLFTLSFRQLLSECEVPNFNRRVYKTRDMWHAWESNPLIQHELTHGSKQVFGEYGHPQIEKGTNELARQMTILPDRVCWGMKDVHMEGNNMFGTCTTVAGGFGDMMRDRALTGVVPMASTRAIGGCDSNGNVLPNFTLITVDGVFRQSSKNAYADMSTAKLNSFGVPKGNSMDESAVPIDIKSESFKDFLLTESVSREKIYRVCDALDLDFDSMSLNENSLTISRTSGNNRETIVMPIHKLIGANHYNLFN